ncbi:MAG: hypothetical protein EA422_15660 [Gemmatimonadales bacterium]|nr:MAG: hypothetical protein EA422_15660 [Gemmatimonadales bacterium]
MVSRVSLAVLFLLVPLVLMPGSAAAQQQAGDIELQFTGTYFTTVGTDFSFASGIIQGKGSYFFTDRVELGAFPSLAISSSDSGVTDYSFGLGVFGSYSFLMEDATTVPYVGFQWWKQDLDADVDWVGVNAGFKFFFSPQVALDLGANYLTDTSDSSQGLFLVQTGLSFLFRR